ncbi:hypothetical protein FEM03_18980 [Phragmitibacter flavus]|uniref:Uncharacterized protein n=1 Tax=Phragmitibacter flavus TaxID=2576071 RepID=A0A5R8KB87_9BACT|nr:hypothetical protein [Phragmitibacter flavus]TLD69185.1 hypothetical protein FEM03_18980 [Phragmitibacter flavus]
MRRPIQTILCLIAAIHLVGGHWGVMQVIAWGNMLHTYSQNQSMVDAVKDTFDGKHPCPMCLKIQQSQTAESEQQPASTTPVEIHPHWLALPSCRDLPTVSWKAAPPEQTIALRHSLTSQWQLSPPTPPPRRSEA